MTLQASKQLASLVVPSNKPPFTTHFAHRSKELAARLAKHGLVHCDLNEFNLMVDLSGIQHELNPGEVVGGHYVRDSGVQKKGEGALSSNDIMAAEVDGTGEKILEEERVKPKQLLPDGTPRPKVTLIDFPQMISTAHRNAKEMYERDVECLCVFFTRKLGWGTEEDVGRELRDGWRWEDVVGEEGGKLDKSLRASGWSGEEGEGLELYY